jgi:uncharacterized cupin superfamily protein
MSTESPLEQDEHGRAPRGDGWFVLNARDARWRASDERPAICTFEGEHNFPQYGLNLNVLRPGEAMSMYHWEADQEDFLVLSGAPVLVIEGEERQLRQWDLVHCPAGTKHVIVGAGDTPSVVLAIGARERSRGPDWGGYTVDEAAVRLGASAEEETADPSAAYARFAARVPSPYRDGWLPGDS